MAPKHMVPSLALLLLTSPSAALPLHRRSDPSTKYLAAKIAVSLSVVLAFVAFFVLGCVFRQRRIKQISNAPARPLGPGPGGVHRAAEGGEEEAPPTYTQRVVDRVLLVGVPKHLLRTGTNPPEYKERVDSEEGTEMEVRRPEAAAGNGNVQTAGETRPVAQ